MKIKNSLEREELVTARAEIILTISKVKLIFNCFKTQRFIL